VDRQFCRNARFTLRPSSGAQHGASGTHLFRCIRTHLRTHRAYRVSSCWLSLIRAVHTRMPHLHVQRNTFRNACTWPCLHAQPLPGPLRLSVGKSKEVSEACIRGAQLSQRLLSEGLQGTCSSHHREDHHALSAPDSHVCLCSLHQRHS
jgi:hypothetical protein